MFGERAIIQRCQAHKIRNVVDQLPDEMKPSVRQAMRDAYAASDADRAHTMLKNLVRRLHDKHPVRPRRSRKASTRSRTSWALCAGYLIE